MSLPNIEIGSTVAYRMKLGKESTEYSTILTVEDRGHYKYKITHGHLSREMAESLFLSLAHALDRNHCTFCSHESSPLNPCPGLEPG